MDIQAGRLATLQCSIIASVAGEYLKPGHNVCIRSGKAYWCLRNSPEYTGTVNPFLAGTVAPNTVFWLFMYPSIVPSPLESEQSATTV